MEFTLKTVEGKGKALEYTERFIIDSLLKFTKFSSNSNLFEEIISESGHILMYGEIGNDLYEILLGQMDPQVKVSESRKQVEDFVTKYPVEEYIPVMRNVVSNLIKLSHAFKSCIGLGHEIIMKAYGFGTLVGMNDKRQVVVSNSVSGIDMFMICVMALNKKVRHQIKPVLKVYDTDLKKLERYYRNFLDGGTYEALLETEDANYLSELCYMIINNAAHLTLTDIYNQIDNYFMPQYSYINTITWEQNHITHLDSNVSVALALLINNIFKPDILKTRSFYVRDKGVRIEFIEAVFSIVSMEVREYHYTEGQVEEHLLNIYYTMESGETRFLSLSMTDIRSARSVISFEKDFEVILLILHWLGVITDRDIVSPARLKSVMSEQIDMEDSYYELLSSVYNDILNEIEEKLHPDNFYYETPAHWNYDFSPSSDSYSPTSSEKGSRIVKVGRYTRRLPAGSKVSESAKALAKKYYIDLKEGYTMVDEFERMHVNK